LEFPTKAEIARMLKARDRNILVGFENESQDGIGVTLNFLLSNGVRSSYERDPGKTYYDHII